MPKILDAVVTYEDQLVELVRDAKAPVTEYVAKGVKLLEDRLPEVSYPKGIATPFEVVESQAKFAKKLIDANSALVTAVLETVAPIAGFDKPANKTVKAPKAA